MKKMMSFLLIFSLFIHQQAYSQLISVAGKIEKISTLDDGRVELQVKTDDGVLSFFVNEQSLIKESLPANKLKKGQTILLSQSGGGGIKGFSGIKGVKGMKSPFGNMSSKTLKNLGLPEIPTIPEVPSVPGIPNVPEIPKVPQVPKVPQIPSIPGKQDASFAGTGNAPSSEQEQQKAPEAEIPELPQDRSFSELSPKPYSAPTIPSDSPKKVVSLKETKKGIEIKLEGEEGEEDVVLSPNETVFKLISTQDLKQNMNVDIEVEGENVRQITVIRSIS